MITSASIVDQTPPVFAEHRKPKTFDQVAAHKNYDSKLSPQLLLNVIKFGSPTNLRELNGWPIACVATPENFILQTVRISGSADYQIYINFLSNLALSLI
jgi:hypothetical protein